MEVFSAQKTQTDLVSGSLGLERENDILHRFLIEMKGASHLN